MAIVHQWSAGSSGGGGEIFTLTEAELNTLIGGAGLHPFAMYHVTDPLGNAANDLWVIAVASDTLSIDAEYLVGGTVTLVEYHPSIPSVTAYAAGGGDTWVVNEAPGGAIDSSNTVYTTALTFQSKKLCVYYNGSRQPPTYYIEDVGLSGFTLTFAPNTGSDLRVDYIRT